MNQNTTRQQIIQRVLDADWTRDDLREAARIERLMQEDAALAEVLADMDAMRAALRLSDGADEEDDLAAPAGGPLAMRRRMIEHVDRTAATFHRPGVIARAWPGVVGGLLAAGLAWGVLHVGAGWFGSDDAAVDQMPRIVVNPVEDSRAWLPEHPNEQREAFSQLATFFDGRAGWVAMTSGDVEIGLEDAPVARTEPVLMRLSLQQPDGRTVQTDLAVLPGQEVDLRAPLADGGQVRYHVTVQSAAPSHPRGAVRLAAYMDHDASLSTELPLTGEPVRPVGRLLTSRGDYLVRLGVAPPLQPATPQKDSY